MTAAILAVTIFALMFILIVTEKFERHYITLVSGLLTLVLVFGVAMHDLDAVWKTLNFAEIGTVAFWYHVGASESLSTGINWATIFFIAGMMVMVEGMAASGFFKWLCMEIAKWAHYRAMRIFIAFMLLSAFLSMFIDSITVILFLAAITAELGRMLGFDPVPMILSEIFCANLGGSATMCGDPPNVIIGTSLGYTFADFIANTGVIAGICLIVVVLYFALLLRRQISSKTVDYKKLEGQLDPKAAITCKRAFGISVTIFLCAVALLITHAQTGLTVAFIGAFAAGATLLTCGRRAPAILKKVDYKTLLFFVGLFIVVGGLEETGVLHVIAKLIAEISQGDVYVAVGIILVVSAIASAFVDNIPFAATMIPVIRSLAETQGIALPTLAWALALGTDIGGSATPIGASANVVGVSIAAKEGYPISWRTYCGLLAPATVLVIAMCLIYIYVRYL